MVDKMAERTFHKTFVLISLDLDTVTLESSLNVQSRSLIINIWDILLDSMTFSGIKSGTCIRFIGADGFAAKKFPIRNCA